jgi:hypothetical protein
MATRWAVHRIVETSTAISRRFRRRQSYPMRWCREPPATAWVTTLERPGAMVSETMPMVLAKRTQPSVALVRALGADSGIGKSKASGICADLDAEGGAFRTLNGTNAPRRGSCSRARSWTTSASAGRTRPGPRSRPPPGRSGPTRSSPACPTATTPRSASGARCWRPGSASWSPSPGPGSPTPPC